MTKDSKEEAYGSAPDSSGVIELFEMYTLAQALPSVCMPSD